METVSINELTRCTTCDSLMWYDDESIVKCDQCAERKPSEINGGVPFE
jgi:uncharacterized Zn ribbon protein